MQQVSIKANKEKEQRLNNKDSRKKKKKKLGKWYFAHHSLQPEVDLHC